MNDTITLLTAMQRREEPAFVSWTWPKTLGLAQALGFSREPRNASLSARLSDTATDTLANTTGDISLCPAAETDGERAEETGV
jgi:hypothetical protein